MKNSEWSWGNFCSKFRWNVPALFLLYPKIILAMMNYITGPIHELMTLSSVTELHLVHLQNWELNFGRLGCDSNHNSSVENPKQLFPWFLELFFVVELVNKHIRPFNGGKYKALLKVMQQLLNGSNPQQTRTVWSSLSWHFEVSNFPKWNSTLNV